jgi:5'-3' exonuclease
MSKILLVDATNNFLRNYTVKPNLDAEGRPIGGVCGFLGSLSYFVRTLAPDKVIVVWDGPGGSRKRRAINENYKAGRKPAKLNRNFDFELEDQEKNKMMQRLRLAEYMRYLPVVEMIIPDVETDDVIGYLVQYLEEDDKIIVSNDKDFYQLVGDKVKVFGPTRREIITRKVVYDKFNVYPENFALARAIVGDSSDNIKGIFGIGFSRMHKYFPFMSGEEKVTVNQLFEFCKKDEKKYKRFLDGEQIIRDNFKIMQLTEPLMGFESTRKIRDALCNKLGFNATMVRMQLVRDGITNEFNDSFFQPFRVLRAKESGPSKVQK